MDRRGFLKRIGGVAAGVATGLVLPVPASSAPLFVPSDRLDFGVPGRSLYVPRHTLYVPDAEAWEGEDAAAATTPDWAFIAKIQAKLDAGHVLLNAPDILPWLRIP